MQLQLSCDTCLPHSVYCRCHALVQSQVQSKNPQRWTAIAAALYNTHRYYKQFLALMQKAIADGLAELEKQLEVRTQSFAFSQPIHKSLVVTRVYA